MFCCLIAALLLGPIGLLVMPRAKAGVGTDCCSGSRRRMFIYICVTLVAAALCLAIYLLAGAGPGAFRHICRVWARSQPPID